MPLATETFWVEYGGRRELIQAGLDYVCPGHELLRRYPGRWAGETTAGRRRRGTLTRDTVTVAPRSGLAQLSPTLHRTRTRGTPGLSKRPARLTVTLGASARRAIEEEFLSTTRVDGYETGGWLFAEPSRSWHKSIEVRVAGGPGKGAKRGSSSFQPDNYQQAEQQLAHDGAGHVCRVGDWHSHPGYDATPSVGDLDVWQTERTTHAQVKKIRSAASKQNVPYFNQQSSSPPAGATTRHPNAVTTLVSGEQQQLQDKAAPERMRSPTVGVGDLVVTSSDRLSALL
jgi:hypothetical protein